MFFVQDEQSNGEEIVATRTLSKCCERRFAEEEAPKGLQKMTELF